MKRGAPGSFGAQLRTLREAAGFTQEELATIAGLSVQAVSSPLQRRSRATTRGAVAATVKGDDAWAARILGARDAVTERTRATVLVRQSLDNLIGLVEREVRARLGPDRWAVAYASGRTASIDALLMDIDRARG